MTRLEQRQRIALAGARTLRATDEGVTRIIEAPALTKVLAEAGDRGFFRPAEDELLKEWFKRFLNLRHALWEVLEESVMALEGEPPRDDAIETWRCFIVGYAAAAQVVRLDRHLVEELADHKDIQRKLNEEDQRFGLRRKQFTRVFESLSDPEQAIKMRAAMSFVDEHRDLLAGLREDEVIGELLIELPRLEASLNPSRLEFLKLAARFAEHAFRRRGASFRQQAAFNLLESGGRIASELRDRWTPKRVNPRIRERAEALLQPGDVIVTRHDVAFTNAFLPGFWPHAALYIGSPVEARSLGVQADAARSERWTERVRTLEALKDGVRLRPLERTLGVDAFIVLRPQLAPKLVARGIERALTHEGKDYNFDFDFFRADRLVCTEVVYRAFDGLDGFEIPLIERAGRPALSAEDLLDLALDTERFKVLSIFGVAGCEQDLVSGSQAQTLAAASYRSPELQ